MWDSYRKFAEANGEAAGSMKSFSSALASAGFEKKKSGAVVYSASGGKSGWSREALSAVAQKLLRELLSDLGR